MAILNKTTKKQKWRVPRVHDDVNSSNVFRTVIDAQSKFAEKAIVKLNKGEGQAVTVDELEQDIGNYPDGLQSIFLELYNECR